VDEGHTVPSAGAIVCKLAEFDDACIGRRLKSCGLISSGRIPNNARKGDIFFLKCGVFININILLRWNLHLFNSSSWWLYHFNSSFGCIVVS
jgi:hypothetical protein